MTCVAIRSKRACLLQLFLTGFACSAVALAQGALQIVSPVNEAIVHSGDSVSVVVSATGATFSSISVIPSGLIPWGSARNAPPYQVTVQIPSDLTPGPYTLIAIGVTTPGKSVTSAPVMIDVERPETPVI